MNVDHKESNKGEYLQERFANIAKKYDFFNDVVTQGLHRHWKKLLLKNAAPKDGSLVIDLCCGTGDIAQMFANSSKNNISVFGLDFTFEMLKVASSRKTSDNLKMWICGDAQSTPFKSNIADIVTIGYGLRNLMDLQTGLKEALRILKPGGILLSLDMGKVKIPILKQLFDFYFFRVVPFIGKRIVKNEDLFDYFPKSTKNFPSQEELKTLLAQVGFIETRFKNLSFGANAIHIAQKPFLK